MLQLTRRVAVLLMAVLLCSCAPRAMEYSALTLREGVAYAGYSETPYSGLATTFHRDGALRARVRFHDGRLDGDLVCFFPNGEAQFVAQLDRGRPVGRAVHYWSGGQVMWEATFVNGILHGPIAAWYLNGQPHVQGACSRGAPDRAWAEYYKDGGQQWSLTFADGRVVGDLLSWYPGDRPRLRGEVDATGDGHYSLFDYDGTCYESGNIDDWALVDVISDGPVPSKSLRRFTSFVDQWIRLLANPVPSDVMLDTRPPN